jgi:glycosyltransferase involved in cell wall biosynthesis
MRIAIYINDSVNENKHLMPWRMVLEIGLNLCEMGHQALIFSGRRSPRRDHWYYGNCPVKELLKPYTTEALARLTRHAEHSRLDAIFWPFAWRGALRNRSLLKAMRVPVVWYVPGACYLFRQVVRAMGGLSLRSVMPFFVQSVYPRKYLVSHTLGPNARFMVTASEYTRLAVCRAGWRAQDVYSVFPGKSLGRTPDHSDRPWVFESVQRQIGGRPFYLFMGPAAAIRGTEPLLKAFASLAGKRPDVCLVCLFRSDRWVDSAGIRRQVERTAFRERIVCVWQSVPRSDLSAFLDACYAVVLPFLLVPSEIPLAVIEAAGHHKPVLTTGPGGTAGFVEEFGMTVSPGRSGELADAMLRLLEDETLYADKCAAARRIYGKHPTWRQTAQTWLSVAQKAVGPGAGVVPEKVS